MYFERKTQSYNKENCQISYIKHNTTAAGIKLETFLGKLTGFLMFGCDLENEVENTFFCLARTEKL